jgi:chorismate-pyruvate lyase
LSAGIYCFKVQPILPLSTLLVLLLLVCCCCLVDSYTYGYGCSPFIPNPNTSGAIQRPRGRQLLVSSNSRALFGAQSDSNEETAQSNIIDPAEASIEDDELFLDEFGHPIEEKRIDYVGAGTLGDIMSSDDGFRFSAPVSAEQLQQTASADDGARGGIDGSTDVDEVKTHATTSSSFATIREDGDALSHDEGLVTTAGGTLQARFGEKIPRMSPLERIALTSNGNLQRIFSSYYDAPVHVHVDRCEMRTFGNQGVNRSGSGDGGIGSAEGHEYGLLGDFELGSKKQHNGKFIIAADSTEPASGGDAVWDREVHLSVHSQRFCTARSVVTVRSEDCIRLVHSGKVGIGQLFRNLDRLPTFEIVDAGRRLDDGGMWRTYTLECRELSCVIREDFVSNAWSIEPTSLNANE